MRSRSQTERGEYRYLDKTRKVTQTRIDRTPWLAVDPDFKRSEILESLGYEFDARAFENNFPRVSVAPGCMKIAAVVTDSGFADPLP